MEYHKGRSSVFQRDLRHYYGDVKIDDVEFYFQFEYKTDPIDTRLDQHKGKKNLVDIIVADSEKQDIKLSGDLKSFFIHAIMSITMQMALKDYSSDNILWSDPPWGAEDFSIEKTPETSRLIENYREKVVQK
ncbi:hypothetical protein KY332_01505 [Candidatus Woesearchaeota archaeon]|nr:hypothetical protein [Candidatus Woesearchaeota archaeon]